MGYKGSLRSGIGTVGIVAVAAALQGCGATSGSSAGFSVPALTPIIKAALPSGLAPGAGKPAQASLLVMDRNSLGGIHALATTSALPSSSPNNAAPGHVMNVNAALASTYINNLFQNSFTKFGGSPSNVTGIIEQQVGSVDDRMSSLGTLSGSCLTSTPTPYIINMSTIDPVLTMSLNNLQCSSSFSNGSPGAGTIVGSTGNNYSLWMSLSGLTNSSTFAALGGFIIFANIQNYNVGTNANPEVVDGISINYTPGTATSGVNNTVVRYIANQTAGTFEFWFASNHADLSNQAGATGNQAACLGAGFRMISNGTLIYADGFLSPTSSPAGCTNAWVPFMACLSATNVANFGGTGATANDTTYSAAGAGACNALSTSFSIPTEAATALTSVATAATAAGKVSAAATATAAALLATAEGSATAFVPANANSGPSSTQSILQSTEISGCANLTSSGCDISSATSVVPSTAFGTAVSAIFPISADTAAVSATSSGH